QCEACGHKLEKIQKMSDAPLRDCPACDKPTLNKLISAAAFRLKGGGWYETDFKSGSRKNVLDGGTHTSGGSDSDNSGADKKSDSKSDSKSESKSDPVPAAAG
ncbi:MAG: zinc ribbon domain-containing protein, partial [Pseudomonadales bacterium]|nr:zinc ribbon domain-containing protein [Pseudomonadales bacterium]